MRKLSLLEHIEQALRLITVALYLISLSWIAFIWPYLRRPLSSIDSKNNNYFSKNFRLKEGLEYVGKSFAYGAMKIFGVEIIVENNGCDMPKNNNETAIVMFTHGSNLDPLLLHAVYPYYLHFIAKSSLFRLPVFGWLFKATRQIPIERTNLTEAIQSLENAGKMIKQEKRSICIAPEGTRRRKPSTGAPEYQFKKGPFHLAKAAGVDIVPAIIIGANRLNPPKSPYPLPGTVIVRFGRKITAKEVEESTLEELQAKVKQVFIENASEIEDKIIYSTKRKPKVQFLITLLWLILIPQAFWRLIRLLF